MDGTVIRYDPTKGYGRILTLDGSAEYSVYAADIEAAGIKVFARGMTFSFEAVPDTITGGRRKAAHLHPTTPFYQPAPAPSAL